MSPNQYASRMAFREKKSLTHQRPAVRRPWRHFCRAVLIWLALVAVVVGVVAVWK